MGTVTVLRRRQGFAIVGRVKDLQATIYANWLALEEMLHGPHRRAA